MEQKRFKDYFSFESIRDKEGEVICYHVTMIGTIEEGGEARLRSDLGASGDRKMAFGKITVRGCNRKIGVLLNETNSRVSYYSHTPEDSYDVISFAARDWRADEVYNFNAGDRVLIEGRAYIRRNPSADGIERRDELTITVTGQFLLGRKRRRFANDGLVPQKKNYSAWSEPEEELPEPEEELPEPETEPVLPEEEDDLLPKNSAWDDLIAPAFESSDNGTDRW